VPSVERDWWPDRRPRRTGKKTQAGDVARILDALKIDKAALVAHDIGIMVAYFRGALS
jgi:pimeloyl-ACP methyl ester carboxylesterase